MMTTLLMPFIDESSPFCNGFECGTLWERLKNGETMEQHPVHAENKEQIELMCRTFGVDFLIEDADSNWCYLTIKSTEVSE